MVTFAFIILHYKNIEKTVQCINSLEKLKRIAEAVIVVVDNGSEDESSQVLQDESEKHENIILLSSPENLGFSRGNNLGFAYIKNNFKEVRFVIVINNDIIIYQEEFLLLLEKKFQEYEYYVAGPDIFTPRERKHYNPLPSIIVDSKGIEERIIKQQKILEKPVLYFAKERVRKIAGICLRTIFGEYSTSRQSLEEAVDVPLHGSALIFSERYLMKYDKAFEPETFLFREEDILYAKCMKFSMRTLYTPELVVQHEHSSSRKMANKNPIRRYTFTIKEYCNSDKIYLKFLNETHGEANG